ncbi:hypothetical protein KIH79_12575, partial [Bifidobacterium sp. 82T10]
QAKQDPTIERARLNTKPRGFIHFLNHTPNQTARPLHTKMRRAENAYQARPESLLMSSGSRVAPLSAERAKAAL